MQNTGKSGAIENLRKGLVHTMQMGDRLVVSLGNLKFNLGSKELGPSEEVYRYYDEKDFDTTKIFNWMSWRDFKTYKSVVTVDEDVDLEGKTKGGFYMSKDF